MTTKSLGGFYSLVISFPHTYTYIQTDVTGSGKTSLITAKYTHPYNGNFLCVSYTNSVSCIEWIFCIHDEVCVKYYVQKESC